MERQYIEEKTAEKSRILEDIDKILGRAGDILLGFICGAVFCYPFAKPSCFEIKGQYWDRSVAKAYNSMSFLTRSQGTIFIEEPNHFGRYVPLDRYQNSINQEIERRYLENEK